MKVVFKAPRIQRTQSAYGNRLSISFDYAFAIFDWHPSIGNKIEDDFPLVGHIVCAHL